MPADQISEIERRLNETRDIAVRAETKIDSISEKQDSMNHKLDKYIESTEVHRTCVRNKMQGYDALKNQMKGAWGVITVVAGGAGAAASYLLGKFVH